MNLVGQSGGYGPVTDEPVQEDCFGVYLPVVMSDAHAVLSLISLGSGQPAAEVLDVLGFHLVVSQFSMFAAFIPLVKFSESSVNLDAISEGVHLVRSYIVL